MKARWLVLAALAAVPACKKDAGSNSNKPVTGGGGGNADPATASEIDTLWKLAPKWANAGAVISGKAMVQVDHALAFLHNLAGRLPGGSEIVEGLGEFHQTLLGSAANYADAGLSLDKGGAVFLDWKGSEKPQRVVAVLPVVDHDKFVKTHGGTTDADGDHIKKGLCKVVDKYYVCGRDASDLVLGGGDVGMKGVDGARGDAELSMWLPQLPPDAPLTPNGPLQVVATVERGQIIAHGFLPAQLVGPLAAIAKSKHTDLNIDKASGFLILPADVMDDAVPMDDAPPEAMAFFKSIAGAFTAVVPAGVADVDVRLPLTDAAPSKALLAACGKVPLKLPMTPGPDSCTIGPDPKLGLQGTVWLDGNTFFAARQKGAVAKAVDGAPATAMAKELAGYQIAGWGRGSLVGFQVPPSTPPEARVAFAAFGYLSEVGFGTTFTDKGIKMAMVARTIHTNPAAISDELEAVIDGGGDAAKIAAIAKAHPDAPIAADVTAGPYGLLVPTAGVGGFFWLSLARRVDVPADMPSDMPADPSMPLSPDDVRPIEPAPPPPPTAVPSH